MMTMMRNAATDKASPFKGSERETAVTNTHIGHSYGLGTPIITATDEFLGICQRNRGPKASAA